MLHDTSDLRSTVVVRTDEVYSIDDKIFFAKVQGDTLLSGLDYCVDSVKNHFVTYGRVVNASGEVQAVLPDPCEDDSIVEKERLQKLMVSTLAHLRDRKQVLEGQCRQMAYYARTHTVIDELYNDVMAHSEVLTQQNARIDTLINVLTEVIGSANSVATRRHSYYINNKSAVLKSKTQISATSRVLATLAPQANSVVSHQDDAVSDRNSIRPTRLVLYGDSLSCSLSVGLAGCLESWFPKPDFVKFDTLGNVFTFPQNDTASHAFVKYKDGSIFSGELDTEMKPSGFGHLKDVQGIISSGFWENGVLTGAGFRIDNHFVKAGWWKSGKFQGERMLYTVERIYGIDISRYQHEFGRRIYPIDWSDLRIQQLGKASRKRIRGVVDYPVSFVFIKATQGTTIVNKYYQKDLRDAQRAGIPVAAYHFFSMKAGKPQADFFIKNAQLSANTLPPMLDVEPTDKEIAQMGGEQVLFREMLIWLKHVEAVCGKRPILYISQNFVNYHMPNAPTELRDYDVWVARYGEYKPYVQLLIWQLSYDGKVKGIHGEVDINVFNGNQETFRQWISNNK